MSGKQKTAFGQVVIGPPGSGKTTYCNGMQQLMKAIGRECCVVNLDPANEFITYDCDVNISELVTLQDVAKNLGLGPNGGLLYCMEYLEKNQDWLLSKLKGFPGKYFIFDCPGQVELYTHHSSLRNVIERLGQKNYDLRLTAVHLVDAHYCSDSSKFISVLLTSLATMLHMNLPHVNVLSKMDIAEQYGKLAFHLDYYMEVLDLNKLIEVDDQDPFLQKYQSLNSMSTLALNYIHEANATEREIARLTSVARVLGFTRSASSPVAKVLGSVYEANIAAIASWPSLGEEALQCRRRLQSGVFHSLERARQRQHAERAKAG